jgi:hypothetical protein
MNFRVRSLVFIGLALCTSMVLAQGTTTGNLGGVVTDMSGALLPGVTIEATHQPTGTRYSTVTDSQGRFKMANVRVGGPYGVTAALEGFHPQESTDTYVSLGEETRLTFLLPLESVTETVTVVGESNPLISPSRTGAASNIVTETIEDMPTLQRGFADFARLNPFFTVGGENEDADAISVAGRSSRYNNIQIDGAVNNDLFGLADSGTPGGQTETTPISLDAISEIQLVLADYDVRNGGFSGGSINMITRNGTNNFHGSVFYFTRDDSFVGDGPEQLGEPGTFEEDNYGFRVGGPISRDKMFFFVNGEISERSQPTGWSLNGATGQCFINCAPESLVAQERFVDILSRYGFDPGGRDSQQRGIDSDKFFGRLDFNIADEHQLTLRYNYVDAVNLINFPGSRTYEWDSEAYDQANETNSAVVQLNSSIGANKFNEARIAFSNVEDRRRGISTFPWVEIEDIAPAAGFFEEFEAGTEPFSTRNGLDNDVLEITDDFTMITGNHTLTFGTHNELFSFENLFVQNAFGSYEFSDLDQFDTGISRRWNYTVVAPGQPDTQKFDVNQFGVYGGDQWTVKPNLTLTYGLRVDIPFFPDSPSFNPRAEELFGVNTSEIPDGEALWQPRFGFNWDLKSDGRQQLRGGAGVFAGRTPYVWISNVYARTGVEQLFIQAFGVPFNPDPFGQTLPEGVPFSFGEFNFIDPTFKFPQVLRYNIAYDHQLPWWNLIGTAELVYADSLKEIDYRDLNIQRTGESVPFDGRPVFERINSDVSGAYESRNTSDGKATNFAVKLERPFRSGVWGYVSYAYGNAEAVNDGTSSRAVSNFQFNEQLDPNNAIATTSDFQVEHRFNASLSYRFNRDSRWPTTLSGFYNHQSGRPYSYIYGSQFFPSVNEERYFSNDLLWIPANEGDVVLSRGTWAELDRYINSEACLKNNRGQIAKRNDCDAPWNTTFDLRVAQDIPIRKTNLQLTFDILNFMNLFDDNAGSLWFANFNTLSPINIDGITDDGRPIYALGRTITDPENNAKYELHTVKSRWRARLGIRWTF